MNIHDVKLEEVPSLEGRTIWEAICKRQSELMEEYKDIEKNFPRSWPIDIDIADNQTTIKDFFWRVTEELAESWEAFYHHEDKSHMLEEVSDAIHFIAEVFILSGTKVNIDGSFSIEEYIKNSKTLRNSIQGFLFQGVIKTYEDILKDKYWAVVYNMGLAANTLKNKAWKQSQVLTNKPKFEFYLNNALGSLLDLCIALKLNAEDFYKLYYLKSVVNKFRIDSKY